ncbi:hypothetical protein DICPUDRAFT_159166 [Dictyostelium purpureum]|uniref:Amino acid transporter transmembrane domain-containing protein n=1 Tax=Dictyostelium purpureum TaxID=5786 RepID=F1A3G0_DICPU|nr:uncharacterized protein DICPUDRAFT_159166 [Dictyostelium purpureum]EGC29268.1 hypothetical protein DICPUDRAFT_159166 [Dictyostelium purpureum]|eukprot:XP_003294205.1 hypothetical protein DICPUDRAFT_159166 [Dictyostelium purpureum]
MKDKNNIKLDITSLIGGGGGEEGESSSSSSSSSNNNSVNSSISTIDTIKIGSHRDIKGDELFNLLEISRVPREDDIFVKEFGLKSIGTIGGICLLIGNITGPGMVNISYEFQQGGWILTTLGYILMLTLSSLAGLFIIESMSTIPGNSRFQLRVEFTMICRFYFGKWGYILSQFFINASLQITNIASIIICSQVMDSIIIFIFKKTCGVSFSEGWVCVSHENANTSPFSGTMFFTIGYLSIIAVIVPLGFMNLNDNIKIQTACVIIMFIIVTSWLIIFILLGLDASNLPPIGSINGISQILGNSMFNYAFITTVPSWVNESKPNVNLKKSIWVSSSISTCIFILIGVFGGLAFSNMSSTSDILSLINASSKSNIFSKFSVYFFPFIVLASSIPVFSIIVRYNLTQNRLMHPRYANFIAILLPWIIVIPFQTGDWLNKISNYSSLFFNSVANFIIPFALYLKSIQFKHRNHISNDQKLILQELSFETIDWAENDFIQTHFKSLTHVPKKYSKRIAQISLIILSITIPIVIITNFYFNN